MYGTGHAPWVCDTQGALVYGVFSLPHLYFICNYACASRRDTRVAKPPHSRTSRSAPILLRLPTKTSAFWCSHVLVGVLARVY